jgi:hypothetical protein
MVGRRRDVIDDGSPGHRPAEGVGIGDIRCNNVNLAWQAHGLLTGDGSNRQPSTDQLVDHGSADRSETGDNVELRFWQGGLILREVDGSGVHMEYAEFPPVM